MSDGWDWNSVVDVFGGNAEGEDEDVSVLLLRLSATRPKFGREDLQEVLDIVFSNYRAKADLIFDNRKYRQIGKSWSKLVSIISAGAAAYASYKSDRVLRSLFRVAFETSEWDALILTPEFIEWAEATFDKVKDQVKDQVRRWRWKPALLGNNSPGLDSGGRACTKQTLLDLFEVVAEFRDRLIEKARLASGA